MPRLLLLLIVVAVSCYMAEAGIFGCSAEKKACLHDNYNFLGEHGCCKGLRCVKKQKSIGGQTWDGQCRKDFHNPCNASNKGKWVSVGLWDGGFGLGRKPGDSYV